jgi:hypothetical protein
MKRLASSAALILSLALVAAACSGGGGGGGGGGTPPSGGGTDYTVQYEHASAEMSATTAAILRNAGINPDGLMPYPGNAVVELSGSPTVTRKTSGEPVPLSVKILVNGDVTVLLLDYSAQSAAASRALFWNSSRAAAAGSMPCPEVNGSEKKFPGARVTNHTTGETGTAEVTIDGDTMNVDITWEDGTTEQHTFHQPEDPGSSGHSGGTWGDIVGNVMDSNPPEVTDEQAQHAEDNTKDPEYTGNATVGNEINDKQTYDNGVESENISNIGAERMNGYETAAGAEKEGLPQGDFQQFQLDFQTNSPKIEVLYRWRGDNFKNDCKKQPDYYEGTFTFTKLNGNGNSNVGFSGSGSITVNKSCDGCNLYEGAGTVKIDSFSDGNGTVCTFSPNSKSGTARILLDPSGDPASTYYWEFLPVTWTATMVCTGTNPGTVPNYPLHVGFVGNPSCGEYWPYADKTELTGSLTCTTLGSFQWIFHGYTTIPQ